MVAYLQLRQPVLTLRVPCAPFTLRGTTRDASKAAANALKDRSLEIVEVNNRPYRAPFSLRFAFWGEGSVEFEIKQVKAIADASVTAGVTQLIWSSLPNVTKMNNGEHGLAHFDSKAVVEEYIRNLNIRNAFFMPTWFMQNHLSIMPLVKGDDGSHASQQPWSPTTRTALIDTRDTGKFLAPVLADPDKYHGKRLTCATAFYTPVEMAETWSMVLGKTMELQQVTEADSNTVPFTEEQKKVIKDASMLMTKYEYFGPTDNDDIAWTLEQMTEKPVMWEESVRDHRSLHWSCSRQRVS
ncbi:hypothetical protein PG994_005951 [Apiospora phragmitis]|uniref:NmrA-like domain-containing protein n=1 Tax=Apiospora phragmitis TaxID=2905665 RepID=A0ABR1VGG0_9PEZI